MQTLRTYFAFLFLFSSFAYASSSSDGSMHDGMMSDSSSTSTSSTTTSTTTGSTTPGSLIIDNSLGQPGSFGVITNMRVGLDDDADNHIADGVTECENDISTLTRNCNSFELESGADLQVIQVQANGQLSIESGVFNSKASSYNNYGTEHQVRLFEADNHLFDIARFRQAAKQLRFSSGDVEPFTYGNISWQQFIDNVAHARTMTGIVRVEIPLQRLSDVSTSTKGDYRYRSRSGKRYGFCGKSKVNTCGCGPGIKVEGGGEEDYQATVIEPGQTICDIDIPSFARIDVRGAILFEWVDCDTREPIPLSDLPVAAEELQVKVRVPLSINPALADSDLSMRTTLDIAALSAGKSCGPSQSCSFPFEVPTSAVSLLPPADQSRFAQTYTSTSYSTLSHAQRYAALLPSGYVKGWSEAFQRLNITGKKWRDLGFQTPTEDNAIISAEHIRTASNNAFEDIPVYMYTGGLFKLEHHINISGLLYIPQAFDLEQTGIKLEKRVKKYDEEYEKEHSKYSAYSYFDKSYSSEDEYHNHEYASCPSKTEHYETVIPAKQFINGAIVVRDGFSIEVESGGGATIIGNDPSSYDNMRGSSSSHLARGFTPFKKTSISSPGNSSGDSSNNNSDNQNGNGDGANNNAGNRPTLPLWMEIRPR